MPEKVAEQLGTALWAVCITMGLSALAQIATSFRKPNGAEHVREMAKEFLEAMKELQSAGQRDMKSSYPPERFQNMHDRVKEIHEVVVTGHRNGAIPQKPKPGATA